MMRRKMSKREINIGKYRDLDNEADLLDPMHCSWSILNKQMMEISI